MNPISHPQVQHTILACFTEHRTRPPEFYQLFINPHLGNSTRTKKICSSNCLHHLIFGDHPPQYNSHEFTTTSQSTTISLRKQHGIQHFQLLHHCWAPSGTERIAPLNTGFQSLTCFTQNIVTDRGYIQTTAINFIYFTICIIPASLRSSSLIEVISVPLQSTLFKLQ